MKKLTLYCLFLMSILESQAQITLKEYDDANRRGYESIVFGNNSRTSANQSNGSTTPKEFNIQENNPYNNLSLPVKSIQADGSKVYEINKGNRQQAMQRMGLSYNPSAPDADEKFEARSHYFISHLDANNVAIAYNQFAYSADGDPSDNIRSSTILILNNQGDVINRLENLPSDAGTPAVSDNAKYLAYAFGERMAHSSSNVKGGFKIVDLRSNQTYYSSDIYPKNVTYTNQMIIVKSTLNGQVVHYIMDQNTGNVYLEDRSPLIRVEGFMQFRSRYGNLTINDLTRIK